MLSSITEKYKDNLAKDNDNQHQNKAQGPNLRPISDRKAFWETTEKVIFFTVFENHSKKSQFTFISLIIQTKKI